MQSVQKALELKSELDDLRPLKLEDEQRIMQKFRLDWNYHSNHLEGNSLTYGETRALILFGITANGKPMRDHFEVSGHNEALEWTLEVVKEKRPLTENFIRELHKLILKEPYEVDAITPDGNSTKKKIEIGQYKSTPNHVKTKTGEIFRFATPEETPVLMQELMDWHRNKTENVEYNPILVAAEFHYRFIRVHPFDDGNGRTARILMNFIFLKAGFPPVIIKTEDKENYFAVLRQADAGSLEPFVEYITKNLIHSLEIMLKGAKGESIEEADDLDKEIALLKQKVDSNPLPKSPTNIIYVKNVFDKTIKPIHDKFLEKSRKFQEFYHEYDWKISSQIFDYYSLEEHFESLLKLRSSNKTTSTTLTMFCTYTHFKHLEFEDKEYISSLSFEFNYNSYTIKNSDGSLSYKRSYSELLTEQEIHQLVHSEMKMHKEFIEKIVNTLN